MGWEARAASDLQTRAEVDLARRRSLGETFRAIFGRRDPGLLVQNNAEAIPDATPDADLFAREGLDPGVPEGAPGSFAVVDDDSELRLLLSEPAPQEDGELDRRFELVGPQSGAVDAGEPRRFSVRVD